MNFFSLIVGNEKIKHYLARMVSQKRVAQSLLFAGPDGIGKSLFALALAKLLFSEQSGSQRQLEKIDEGVHPDIRIYHPEGKSGMHSMESMRQLIEEVYLPPNEAPYKIFIVHEAERMLTYSANALLKTFEEPAVNSIIILLSHHSKQLLPTILSRCSQLYFNALSEGEIARILQEKKQISLEESTRISQMANGSMRKAIGLLDNEREFVREFLLKTLACGRLKLYSQITGAAQTITEDLEKKQKQKEEALRELLKKTYPDGATLVQQQAIDKEVEGVLALNLIEEAQRIFDCILSWYRDMQLLHVGAPFSFLINKDYHSSLEESLQRGEFLPLERVLKWVSQAGLSLSRSTPLSHCLENLLLQLNH